MYIYLPAKIDTLIKIRAQSDSKKAGQEKLNVRFHFEAGDKTNRVKTTQMSQFHERTTAVVVIIKFYYYIWQQYKWKGQKQSRLFDNA